MPYRLTKRGWVWDDKGTARIPSNKGLGEAISSFVSSVNNAVRGVSELRAKQDAINAAYKQKKENKVR